MQVNRIDDRSFMVSSESDARKEYLVYYSKKMGRLMCDCEDSLFRAPSNPQHKCKHILLIEKEVNHAKVVG